MFLSHANYQVRHPLAKSELGQAPAARTVDSELRGVHGGPD